jgi:hypothetical protein
VPENKFDAAAVEAAPVVVESFDAPAVEATPVAADAPDAFAGAGEIAAEEPTPEG